MPPAEGAPLWFEDETALERELRAVGDDVGDAPTIAGYVDLVEIGRGGQARVYRALQSATRRAVAIKVFHDAPGRSSAAMRRFEREVEVVAGLRHPSIVTVFDGGTTRQGRPYLVMELVRGCRLDEAPVVRALHEQPNDRERLLGVTRLLATVADAVAQAHLRGVLHRDLKPANILVDDEGLPRVLDFGLARVVEGSTWTRHSLTADGSFSGSLPWASPEQARGESVDLRADVYALGVIAFELLVGRRPYELPNDLKRALAVVADPRPQRLAAALPGVPADLDAIVMRCLMPERERRYQSAGELARDLERFLSGEPIEARAEGAWSQVRRRMRRARSALIAAGLLLAVVGAALVVSLSSLDVAREATTGERRKAERLEGALEWVVSMIKSVDPDKHGEEARVYDLLLARAPRLDADFADDVESRRLLRATFAAVFESLGHYEEAEREYRRQLDDFDSGIPDQARSRLICEANVLRMEFYRRRDHERIPVVEDLYGRMRNSLGPTDIETVKCGSMLATWLRAKGDLAAARVVWERSLAEGGDRLDPAQRLQIDESLAGLASLEGKLQVALAAQRDVVERRRRDDGTDAMSTLRSEGDLAFYLTECGRLEEAEVAYADLEGRVRAKLGPDHPVSIMVAENFAKLIQDRGRVSEAIPRFEDVLERRCRKFGDQHPQTLVTFSNLAIARSAAGDAEGATETHRRILEIRRRTAPEDSFELINAINSYATGLCLLDRAAEALPLHEEAIERSRRAFGSDHWADATFRVMYANCLVRLGRTEEAKTVLTEARAVLVATLGAEHGNTKTADRLLALLAAGDVDQ